MHFVIAGRINCSQYAFAIMIAERLKENLPNFTYLKISKSPEDWEKWLLKTCRENQWYHVKSHLIWREIGLKKGKKEFIGDINRFLDICYDYYGVPRDVLAADDFNKAEMDWFKNRTESEYFESIKEEAKNRREYRSRQVCITGASSQITEIIIMELLQTHCQSREGGLEIRLFDELRKESKLVSSANDAKYCPGPSGLGNCRVATTLKDALLNVDLVIVLDSFPRKAKESVVKWLKRNRNAMCALGKGLNMYAKVHCRVIIGSPSNQPNCYNANVLASFATKLHVRNIVVVTQDLGRETLKPLSIRAKVPLNDLYCPPVWGFVGLNKYVDLARTLQTNVYKVPGKRKNSTLPQGTEEYEIRTVDCLISEEDTNDINVKVCELKVEALPQLGRWPCLAKAAAIIDLLKIWGLKQEDGGGEIICLGVYSDGTFNIPEGLYWSQPVVLKKGFWVPFPQYPVPRNYPFSCYYLFLFGLAALYRTKVKPRRYVPPKREIKSRTKKFDFEQIVKSVEMPVIRTDLDCVNYLRNLAKSELGIDFDRQPDYDLEEKSEPEEIVPAEIVSREELYCECWRQELKELQKVVFYRDSTTEVEVDLSENLSGSEWSVINTEAPTVSITIEASDSVPQFKTSVQKVSLASSGSTVCSCGILPNGSLCHCLDKEKSYGEAVLSTEHFYKEQNAQIFQDDVQDDVIYEDSYEVEKRVRFDPQAFTEDKESQLPRHFYGKKDAIKDEKAMADMKRRILKYEKGSESSQEEGQEEDSKSIKSKESLKEPKFHIAIEGVPFEIIGDQEGFESLGVRQNKVESPSTKSFREMYVDEMSSLLHVNPPLIESSETPSESYPVYEGEGKIELDRIYGECPESFAFDETPHQSVKSLEKALDEIYSNEMVMEEFGEEYGELEEYQREELDVKKERTQTPIEEENEEEKLQKVPKWKRHGIPVCCLCRCIVPEGLPFCPCGSTTVVEVFKKESIEVFIQNEDDMSFRIEYKERYLPRESVIDIPEEPVEKVVELEEIKELPPESFFPFSPKTANEFQPTQRPKELTKEFLDSVKETGQSMIPEKCIELMNLAEIKLKEENEKENEKKDDESESKDSEDECFKDKFLYKTNFSDLNLFTPEGIEDWRITVQTKYREWFYQGPRIRDESYYDMALEEVSDDELDVDEEFKIYFET